MHGSSPLTRGKPIDSLRYFQIGRLIPAHAGKTITISKALEALKAHPRSRGENNTKAINGQTFTGSSPLTRGKLCTGLGILRGARLIPAHAGKTVCILVLIP